MLYLPVTVKEEHPVMYILHRFGMPRVGCFFIDVYVVCNCNPQRRQGRTYPLAFSNVRFHCLEFFPLCFILLTFSFPRFLFSVLYLYSFEFYPDISFTGLLLSKRKSKKRTSKFYRHFSNLNIHAANLKDQ
jgi:hypothetical protein